MIEGLYATQLIDELLRLLSDRAGWPATTFRFSTIGLMEEIAKAGTQAENGILSPASFEQLKAKVRDQILIDPGLGSMRLRGPLLAQIPREAKEFVSASFKYKAWVASIPAFGNNYLQAWKSEFESSSYDDELSPDFPKAMPAYDAACFISSHLIHLGISGSYLSRWIGYRARIDQSPYNLNRILEEINSLAQKGRGPSQVLVGISRSPQEEIKSIEGWVNASSAREWLTENDITPPSRLHGGILYKSEQWDLDGALLNVSRSIQRLRQRMLLKTGKSPDFLSTAWIAGLKQPRCLPPTPQLGRVFAPGYEISAVRSEAPPSDDRLEVAIELLLAALSEAGASAVGTLWASLEALLAAPGDPDRLQVAHRAADIALVALVRASVQVAMGNLFSRCPEEAIAQRINLLDRRAKLVEFEESLRRDDHADLPDRSTRLILSHTKKLLDPAALKVKRDELRDVLLALYRQRNLVLHGGITDGPILGEVLRAATPVVAAVINLYARANRDGAVDPHLYAYDMFLRLEGYFSSPDSIADAFW